MRKVKEGMDFFRDIERFGKKTALLSPAGQALNYAELAAKADSLTGKLQRNRLAFNLCGNNLESLVGYLGFLRHKIPQALINPETDSDLIRNLLNSYRPKYLWCSDNFNFVGYRPIAQEDRYKLLESADDFNYPINPELALLLTTSGSTGSPKLVRQSYTNIAANAASIAEYLEIDASDRPITTLPMSYTYGLSIINSHLFTGSEIILNEKSIVNREFWAALKEQQATSFGGVPFSYEILKKLKFERLDLPYLNKLTQAGGKLNDSLCREFAEICRKKQIRFFVMYGQTEATARISFLDCSRDSDKIGSVGKAIPGGTLSMVDDQSKPILSNGTPGELVYQGPNVTLGYATSYLDLQLADQNNGTLHTGDIAKRDEQGFYYIVGRKKRFLKLFGSRVNLDELEGLLHGTGIEAACTGEDDLLKVHTTDEHALPQIKELLTKKLGLNHSGFKIILVAQVPRTDSGKIEYSKLPAAAVV